MKAKQWNKLASNYLKSLIERYNDYAKTKSNPRSHFMREALVEYIERKEKNNKDYERL